MRIVLGRSEWNAKAHVYDATERTSAGKASDNRAHEGVSDHQRFDHRRFMEFSGKEKDQEVQAASARRARRYLANAAGGHRSCAGISKVYRMFSLSGCLPCSPRPPDAREIHWTAFSHSRRSARDASTRHGGSYRGIAKHAGNRLLQHHKMLHKSLSREH